MSKSRKNLSRFLSHALRHSPDEYGLVLDHEGWASIDDLVASARKQKPEWLGIDEDAVRDVIESSPKQRHEIHDGRIRAKYGHSVPVRSELAPENPPEFLYHGTSRSSLRSILSDGLKPMSRQFVHLSTHINSAISVGSRKASDVVVLKVTSGIARDAGNLFYLADKSVWLTEYVSPDFLIVECEC